MTPGTERAEWSCGHVAGAVCAECYRILAAKAHELVEENDSLREENARLSSKPSPRKPEDEDWQRRLLRLWTMHLRQEED